MIYVEISRIDNNWQSEEDLKSQCEIIINTAVEYLQLSTQNSEISLVFSNEEEIKKLNKKWRNKDSATNVLSFPTVILTPDDNLPALLGDIILSYETIAAQAKDFNKDFWHHASYLIIHGLLHLLGYDHDNPKNAQNMENLEINILKRLEITNPYEIC
ncbi:rRNA maturation RNase YbeY [Bartonella sp. DGB1]|uniref:rRNA maturation RNase YbeY n=1 Tax=Bartonella sp. DGB1 TaxID=3239807 RepID=UPI003526B888